MYLPKLNRDKNKYTSIQSQKKLDLALIIYLFFTTDLDYRSIEINVLKENFSGYRVLDILKYYGLKSEHRNIIGKVSYDELIEIIDNQSKVNKDYYSIYQLISLFSQKDIDDTGVLNVVSENDYVINLNTVGIIEDEFRKLTNIEKKAYYNMICKIRNKDIQDNFRKNLISEFSGKCALCEIDNVDLLVASHIIPYSQCNGNIDIAGDSNNGLLLCPNHDILFESSNYISFDKNGKILISKNLKKDSFEIFGINFNTMLEKKYLTKKRLEYLKVHMTIFYTKNSSI